MLEGRYPPPFATPRDETGHSRPGSVSPSRSGGEIRRSGRGKSGSAVAGAPGGWDRLPLLSYISTSRTIRLWALAP